MLVTPLEEVRNLFRTNDEEYEMLAIQFLYTLITPGVDRRIRLMCNQWFTQVKIAEFLGYKVTRCGFSSASRNL